MRKGEIELKADGGTQLLRGVSVGESGEGVANVFWRVLVVVPVE